MPLICMGKDIETQRRETFSPAALVNIPLLLIASTTPLPLIQYFSSLWLLREGLC